MKRAFDFIANTADAVCVVDRRQRIVLWNDAARDLLGFEARNVLGRRCYDVFGGTDAAGCAVCHRECAVQRSAAHGERALETREVEVNSTGGGRTWVSVSTVVFPSTWHELSVLAHLMRDASANKVLETGFEQLLRCVVLDRAEGNERVASARARKAESRLTQRESEVLELLACGSSTDAIASRLSIAKPTVRTHVQHILNKLGVHSRLEAVAVRTPRVAS